VLGRQRSADRFKRIFNTVVLRMWRKMRLRREHEKIYLEMCGFPRSPSNLFAGFEIFDERTGGCADEGSGRGFHERGQGL